MDKFLLAYNPNTTAGKLFIVHALPPIGIIEVSKSPPRITEDYLTLHLDKETYYLTGITEVDPAVLRKAFHWFKAYRELSKICST